MTIREFEKLTGFYPSADMYAEIEGFYNDFDGSKEEFCAAYKTNKDGLAEKIQRYASFHAAYQNQGLLAIHNKTQEELAGAKLKISALEVAIETAQNWKKYGTGSHMSDADYLDLEKRGEPISEERAKEIIHHQFGFAMDFIVIVNELNEWEKNVAGKLRKCGTVSRLPVYGSTDWNYIRFDVNGLSYELVDGELYFIDT